MALQKDVISQLAPQMQTYYELKPRWCPYLMFTQPVNFKSKSVNTDDLGLRINHYQGTEYSIAKGGFKNKQVSLLIGGSTVFGDGASSDAQTISAHLSENSGELFLNLGGRAYNSTQELITFNQVAHQFGDIKNIILLSGLNDLYLSQFANNKDYFGSFFFSAIMDKAVREYSLSSFQKLMKLILSPIFGDKLAYDKVDKFNWFPSNTNYQQDESINNQIYNVDDAIFQIKKNLWNWSKIAQSYQCKLKYILQPFPDWAQKNLSIEEQALLSNDDQYDFTKLGERTLYLDYVNKLKNLCSEFDIEFHDSNNLVNEYSGSNDWIFIDRAHLTDDGNKLMARIIQGTF
jgi:hypothetical protein